MDNLVLFPEKIETNLITDATFSWYIKTKGYNKCEDTPQLLLGISWDTKYKDIFSWGKLMQGRMLWLWRRFQQRYNT